MKSLFCVKVINFALGLFGLTFLTGCAHKVGIPMASFRLETYSMVTSGPGEPFGFGGYSGLRFIGLNPKNNELQFLTHTDRGPNGEPQVLGHQTFRPFLMPSFHPSWAIVETNSTLRTLNLIAEVPLKDFANQPLSGLPENNSAKPADGDEVAIDQNGKQLPEVPMGFDLEGLCKDENGFVWMSEEYRPSILKFNSEGRLLKRFIPKNSLPKEKLSQLEEKYGKNLIVESLPEVYRLRQKNRGFEGIACYKNKIYAILQSPIPLPPESSSEPLSSLDKGHVRLVEFDITTEKVTAEFYYPMNQVDRIGDIEIDPRTGEFYCIEQNGKSGPQAIQRITHFFLPKAGGVIEHKVFLSLPNIGYAFAEKIEGLAYIDEHRWAIINDNDFGIEQNKRDPNKKSVLGIITSKK